jgi:hypothetical protein
MAPVSMDLPYCTGSKFIKFRVSLTMLVVFGVFVAKCRANAEGDASCCAAAAAAGVPVADGVAGAGGRGPSAGAVERRPIRLHGQSSPVAPQPSIIRQLIPPAL